MSLALQVSFLVLFPAAALYLSRNVKAVAWLGPVGLCYLAGILVANTPYLGASVDRSLSMRASEIAVPLSIPLLLFATQLRSLSKLAGPTLLAFFLAIVATLASALLFGRVFKDSVFEAWKIAGMLVGVYVGGTANMSVIGLALEVKEETFVLLSASDVMMGGAYLVFVLTIAQRVLWWFLPRFGFAAEAVGGEATPEPAEPLFWRPAGLMGAGVALGAAMVIAGVSAGISFAIFDRLNVALVLMLITTFAITASFIRSLRENPFGFRAGEYLQLIFCVAMGSMASVSELSNTNGQLLIMVAAVQFTAIALHFALCALFRVDADTVLITSTATIFGPAFIGPVAKSLNNRQILFAGIATALAGLAVANYLGLTTAWVLEP